MTKSDTNRALIDAEEQVERYRRRLARSDRPGDRGALAGALVELAVLLQTSDRVDEALPALRESVDLYRRLCRADAAGYLPGLALASELLGGVLGAIPHRRAEASTAARSAVELYRTLALVDGKTYVPRLATALAQLGNHLAVLGNRGDALAALREAVDLRRKDVPGQDRDFAVADALVYLGIALDESGSDDEALSAIEEAIGLYRRRVGTDATATQLTDYYAALLVYAPLLAKSGHDGEAQRCRQEATDLYRRIAALDQGLTRHLAAGLGRFGFTGMEDGQPVRAAAPEAGPAPDPGTLAYLQKLSDAGAELLAADRPEEALAFVRQAADLAGKQAETDPRTYLLPAARCRHNLGLVYSRLGRTADAAEAYAESVRCYRRLRSAAPGRFLSGLAGSLTNLGDTLESLGRVAEAVEPTREAADILRPLAAGDPVLLPRLALAVNNLGWFLTQLGRHADALAPAQEAVDILRRLAAAEIGGHRYELARALNNLGDVLTKLRRRREARAAFREAKAVYRPL
ncbi:tetratricopeptide repeat protein [Amycolatopsis cynarae]|uniref:Tetratricopeptide repeat protein n=1 Tax=Amycolatopsis cynarae TaxID=2995223 RepID=A0ABY7AY77_9PSEU|nr:tetratricopeptide repeat protein [Amycolatopsis sp. HUAS 11-8]WAL64677.1 tetratricopeptide repeat protein [Amycolatopsis sp. HUAS 11-8]